MAKAALISFLIPTLKRGAKLYLPTPGWAQNFLHRHLWRGLLFQNKLALAINTDYKTVLCFRFTAERHNRASIIRVKTDPGIM